MVWGLRKNVSARYTLVPGCKWWVGRQAEYNERGESRAQSEFGQKLQSCPRLHILNEIVFSNKILSFHPFAIEKGHMAKVSWAP